MAWQHALVAVIVAGAVAFLVWKLLGGRRALRDRRPHVKTSDLVRKKRERRED